MDPGKLKVVELRAELSSRGLDTKGNKAVLVKRLREALEEESGNGKICFVHNIHHNYRIFLNKISYIKQILFLIFI